MTSKYIPLFSEGELLSWPFHKEDAFLLLSEFISSETRSDEYDLKTNYHFLPDEEKEDLEENDGEERPPMYGSDLETMVKQATVIKWRRGEVFLSILKNWSENETYWIPTSAVARLERAFPNRQAWQRKNNIERFTYFVKETGSLELVILSALVCVLEEEEEERKKEKQEEYYSPNVEPFLHLLFYPQVGEHVFLIGQKYKEYIQMSRNLYYWCFDIVISSLYFEERIANGYNDVKPKLRNMTESVKNLFVLLGEENEKAQNQTERCHDSLQLLPQLVRELIPENPNLGEEAPPELEEEEILTWDGEVESAD